MSDTFKVCCCFTRKFNSQVVEPVDEIKKIFEHYSDGSGLMDAEQLRRFLVEVQKEEEEEEDGVSAQAIIEGFKQGKHFNNLFHKKGISLDGFFRYLLSQDNHPMPNKIVHHNMDAPMSHYFMFTGHNSYLTGNQLNSDSSDVPIIKALQKGVRVIELDLWPNSKKDDVIVCHGGTLTTPVELRKCLRSIKEHAFDTSQYPVVITLEDHLNADLQAKVAQMVTETFGDMLFYPKLGSLEVLPSPESLKGRVMLSTKPPKEYLVAKVSQEDISERDKDPDEDTWGKEVPDLKAIEYTQHDESVSLDHHPSGDNMGDDDDDDDEKLARLNSEKVPLPEYKRLITIRAGKQKGGIKEWLKVEPNKVRRLSLSEQEVGKAIHSHATDIIRFTQHNILRIYPMGIRFDSSNYNPMIGWIHGAQMVALNMQGYGRSLWVMHGLFKANGGCGYVKKPDFLLKTGQKNEVFDPRSKLPVKKTLVVRVYMGDGWHLDFKKTHFDKFSPPDFYTRVGIAGVPDDTIMMKTKIIEDNWSPVWDEEFRFPLTVPELAVLRIEVHEYDMSEKDDFGGQTCFPVSELKSGIRAVPLCDRKGDQLKSVKLLMKFDLI